MTLMYECRVDFPDDKGSREFGTGRLAFAKGNEHRSPYKFDCICVINCDNNKPVAYIDLQSLRKFIAVIDAAQIAAEMKHDEGETNDRRSKNPDARPPAR